MACAGLQGAWCRQRSHWPPAAMISNAIVGRAVSAMGIAGQGVRQAAVPLGLHIHGRYGARWHPHGHHTSPSWQRLRCSVAADGADGAAEAEPAEEERVVERELRLEAQDSYLAYAMSVIVGRALPDARDGLKPVHRRILYAMHDMGLTANKPYRKCARVVGEVLGKYHPHGDTAVYDALVRMAQDFSMRAPLVAGHGNFGSIDNDPPAAMRYTEARLAPLSQDMLLADLDPSVVDYTPTFDGAQDEPTVLPTRVPNLLVNGSQGIAVGIATKIPPHNLSEVLNALDHLAKHRDCSTADLMQHLPGPDFPTGGIILNGTGMKDAYETGKGGVTVRAKVVLEASEKAKKKRSKKGAKPPEKNTIVITELPYQVNKADLITHIADLVENGTLTGISDVRDESDRDGMRMVVEVKRGTSVDLVLNNLYKHTRLQIRFNANMVALVDGTPRSLTLKQMLSEFLDFRSEVVMRRARQELETAQARLHLVEGFLAAMEEMERVIRLIRESADGKAAKRSLMDALRVSDTQAEGILNLSLRRLTSMESTTLTAERADLEVRIADIEDLLSNDERLLSVVLSEARALEKKYGNQRRTEFSPDDEDGEIKEIDTIPNTDTILTLSDRGYIKRMEATTFATQNRGGRGKRGGGLRTDDMLAELIALKAHDDVLFFTSKGHVHTLKAYQVPAASRTSGGAAAARLLSLGPDEEIAAMLPVTDYNDGKCIVLMTRSGMMKKTPLAEFEKNKRKGKLAMRMLVEGDSLLAARICEPDSVACIASSEGRVLCFSTADMRPRSRIAGGVKTMGLKDEAAEVVGFTVLPAGMLPVGSSDDEDAPSGAPWLVMVTEAGLGKRVPALQFRVKAGRRGFGVVGIKLREGDRLAAVRMSSSEAEEAVLATRKGVVNRIPLSQVRECGRTAQGVKIMNIDDDVIKSMAVQKPKS